MVDRAGGYFDLQFKGYCNLTQGNRLSPTHFNVVVDTFLCGWVTAVVPTNEGMEEHGLLKQDLAAYFYADDGLVASTQPERIQRAFDVLTGH